jgi:hypothetical protein
VRSDPDPDPDADDDDSTGSITQAPAATIPVEIGEPSAFELPVSVPIPEERPPIISPRRVKSRTESRLIRTHHGRRTTAQAQNGTKNEPPPLSRFFETIFGGQKMAPGSGANTANR